MKQEILLEGNEEVRRGELCEMAWNILRNGGTLREVGQRFGYSASAMGIILKNEWARLGYAPKPRSLPWRIALDRETQGLPLSIKNLLKRETEPAKGPAPKLWVRVYI